VQEGESGEALVFRLQAVCGESQEERSTLEEVVWEQE